MKKSPGNSSGCLELVVVSQTGNFEQQSGGSSKYPQPGRDNWDAGWTTLECCAQDKDTSGYQVSDLEDIEFYREDPDLNMDAVFQQAKILPFSFQILMILRCVQ